MNANITDNRVPPVVMRTMYTVIHKISTPLYFFVQSVLHLKPHMLEVFFATPLSNCFINYALVKLVPFLSNPAS